MSVFSQYSAYYDLLYHDKDYRAEAEYIDRIIRGALPTARTVLELGSGTGCHGRLLADMGYDVYGIERSAEMVALAREGDPTKGHTASTSATKGTFTCEVDDVRYAQVERRFDAVASLFHVMSYQTTNADAIATFQTAARHLNANGVFIFDVWHGPAVLAQKPEVRVKRVESSAFRILRVAEPVWDSECNRITVRYTIMALDKETGYTTEFTEEHPMRYYFPLEIQLLAAANGFDIESSQEWLSGNPPSDATWGVAYLLRKV